MPPAVHRMASARRNLHCDKDELHAHPTGAAEERFFAIPTLEGLKPKTREPTNQFHCSSELARSYRPVLFGSDGFPNGKLSIGRAPSKASSR